MLLLLCIGIKAQNHETENTNAIPLSAESLRGAIKGHFSAQRYNEALVSAQVLEQTAPYGSPAHLYALKMQSILYSDYCPMRDSAVAVLIREGGVTTDPLRLRVIDERLRFLAALGTDASPWEQFSRIRYREVNAQKRIQGYKRLLAQYPVHPANNQMIKALVIELDGVGEYIGAYQMLTLLDKKEQGAPTFDSRFRKMLFDYALREALFYGAMGLCIVAVLCVFICSLSGFTPRVHLKTGLIYLSAQLVLSIGSIPIFFKLVLHGDNNPFTIREYSLLLAGLVGCGLWGFWAGALPVVKKARLHGVAAAVTVLLTLSQFHIFMYCRDNRMAVINDVFDQMPEIIGLSDNTIPAQGGD